MPSGGRTQDEVYWGLLEDAADLPPVQATELVVETSSGMHVASSRRAVGSRSGVGVARQLGSDEWQFAFD